MTGWIIGWTIGGVVVVVVAVLALVLISQARKIGAQAADIHASLIEARDHTAGLWEIDRVNRALGRVGQHARAARHALGGTPR